MFVFRALKSRLERLDCFFKGLSSQQSSRWGQAGMTIVEIMIVLAIIASVMGMGIGLLSDNSAADLRKDANRLATAIRYTYSNAALTNSRYRLVFDMDKGNYYTEVEEPALLTNDSADSDEFMTEEARALGEKNDKAKDLFDEKEDPFGLNRKISYKRVEDGLVKDTKLSDGISFDEVKTTYRPEPYTHGKASMSFFPGGFQDQMLIYLKDKEGDRVALLTEPMTGRVIVYTDLDAIPSDFGQVERDG